MTDAMMRDLTLFLNQKTDRAIEDFLERTKWSGKNYSRDEIVTAIVAVMMRQAANAERARTKSTIDVFLTIAREAYQRSE